MNETIAKCPPNDLDVLFQGQERYILDQPTNQPICTGMTAHLGKQISVELHAAEDSTAELTGSVLEHSLSQVQIILSHPPLK